MRVRRSFLVERKRRLDSDEFKDELETAKETWAQMRALKQEDLLDPSKITRLPFPGIWNAYERLPPMAEIVGVPDVAVMVDEWDLLGKGLSLMMVGGKGIGKSVRLRIFACMQYAKLPKGSRLLCIWNANRPVIQSMRDALLFTYAEEDEVVNELRAIESLNGFHSFLSKREVVAGERFSFIVDAAQSTDLKTWYKEFHDERKEKQVQLQAFLSGRRTLWGVSPKAGAFEKENLHASDSITRLECCTGFGKEALEKFLSISVLGKVLHSSPDREEDVAYYSGCYPFFLAILDRCCWDAAAVKEKHIMQIDGEGKSTREVFDTLNAEDVVALLQDPEDWESVLTAFRNHPQIQAISKGLSKLQISRTCHRIQEMMALDPRYVLDAERGLYASPYVHVLYVDAFREKEQDLYKTQSGPWVAYCSYLLGQKSINWAEMGWICERLCSDVVSRFGLDVGNNMFLRKLTAERFSKVPRISKFNEEGGIVYFSDNFSYGSVDAVVVYRDKDGKHHFFGLQFTTSFEKHKHSEDQFMNVAVVEEWIPFLMQQVDDWNFHFVFVCLTSKEPKFKSGNLCQLRGGRYYGVLPHTLHVRNFVDALGRDRVGHDVYQTLVEIASRRENHSADKQAALPFPAPPSTVAASGPLKLSEGQLRNLKRAQLDAIAMDGNLDPRRYRNIALLIEALKNNGLLLIE